VVFTGWYGNFILCHTWNDALGGVFRLFSLKKRGNACKSQKKVVTLQPQFKKDKTMDDFKKYLGVALIVLGVLCLVIYKFSTPENWLLVSSMVLEVGGILAYIFINKKA
jgi:hypothetical protein